MAAEGCNLSPKKKIDIARNGRRTDLKGNKLLSLWTNPKSNTRDFPIVVFG
jgi:hypothetical protein